MMHPKVFIYRGGKTQSNGDEETGSHFGLVFPELALLHLFRLFFFLIFLNVPPSLSSTLPPHGHRAMMCLSFYSYWPSWKASLFHPLSHILLILLGLSTSFSLHISLPYYAALMISLSI